jgi:lysyl-tRNA synthetase, class II
MDLFDPRRQEKLASLRALSIEPFPAARPVSHTMAELCAFGEDKDADQLAGTEASWLVAGRILAKNEMGRAGFAMLQDRAGRLQVYVRSDDVGEESFELWKKLDLGDVVRVGGKLMRTRRGDLTLKAASLDLASKCLRSLPDKWNGLTDTEFRHRHRYVDLIMNPEVRSTFEARTRIVREIRRFFDDRGFLEVETPMMQAIPGGAAARPFVTHHNALDADLYLRIAPELFLKRLVVGGFERVYELNRCFRNEGVDLRHNPEFTMLEFYQAHATYLDLLDLTEELVSGVVLSVCGSLEVPVPATERDETSQPHIDFSRPWRRRSMQELLEQHAGLCEAELFDAQKLRERWLGDHPEDAKAKLPGTWGSWWAWFFDAHVERKLQNPTFVLRFPVDVSPLSRRSDDDPRFVDRFECYAGGQEICNAFTELNDPEDQAARFEDQVRKRAHGDDEAMYFDADYVEALCYGMPPTAGEGIGIDRLVMLLTGQSSIREVILFPLLRPRREASPEDDAPDGTA